MTFKRVSIGRIEVGALQIGVPIPYSVFDENYNLLLHQGVTLTNQRQLDALFARGLYRVEDVTSVYEALPQQGRPLVRFDQLCRELNSLLSSEDLGGAEFPERILSLAARLGNLCEQHAEACLAGILHDQESRYAVRHMVHVAIVSRRLAGVLKLGESDCLSLIAAALTMNLAILGLQNELHGGGDRSLSAADRLVLRSHPEQSVARLSAMGVNDPLWLDAVAQHHEAFDGSGYPGALAGTAIGVAARIIGLVDSYTARLRPRDDRGARLPNESLREIFVSRGSSFDPALTAALVRAVGIYPPGLVVELESGEIGVVTRLGGLAHAPEVHVVVSARSTLLKQPMPRSTAISPNRIRHALVPGRMRFRFDPLQFWAES